MRVELGLKVAYWTRGSALHAHEYVENNLHTLAWPGGDEGGTPHISKYT